MNKRNIVMVVSGLAVIAVLLLLYFGLREEKIFTLVRKVLHYSFLAYIISISFLIFIDRNSPQSTVAWLVVFFAFPYVGLIFYILIGRNLLKRRTAKKRRDMSLSDTGSIHMVCNEALLEREADYGVRKIKRLLQEESGACLSDNNSCRILRNGSAKFYVLFQKIQEAKDHIHLEYFILRDGRVGERLKELLIEKAREGVEVRLIYDAVGCWTLSKDYRDSLKKAGVKIKAFYPVVFPVLSRELNYRNHRKLVVIDGIYGFVGGINVGDEYLGLEERFGFWRDTHMMLQGDAVRSLQKVFANDWRYITGELLDDPRYFPVDDAGREEVQILESGPDYNWEAMRQAFFAMITGAHERLWIATPYLVPDEAVAMALSNAAKSGVDVRIILPNKADHLLVYWASRDFIEGFLEDGVRIFTYEKGFIHAKTLLVDGSIASLGTANLDNRSLGINYEVNAFLYSQDIIASMEKDYVEDLQESNEILLEDHLKRPFSHKIMESFGRIFSPLQ